ncbi:FAD-binding oxidoreductase [Sinomonas sp. R1AF57]|uniref:FAD-binding oxidoreductase n=1 Tax=Sinomonas sp. R1AF57 TaxID=2020377 RepID=UPI000B5EF047|nr:FAD-binding oxidoreductase [Sinomonas sp. R1AF57]ASN52561.1 oxidoreductase [Sinomonas sp. R1AF57]
MSTPAFNALRESVRGTVIEPDDEGYEAARRVYNGMVDKHPAAVLRVAQTADVITAVRFARDAGLDLAIRGGGHSAPGFGTVDDGLVLDFSAHRGVWVDPREKRARAEAGATWGDYNHATHAFGLASTGGILSTTGVAGLTLGGGIGYLARKHGLACDNLLSADVVLADGRLVRASAESEPDLFWALRGGGGNFGVVTSFEFALHDVDTVHVGIVAFPAAEGIAVGEFYRDWIASQPEEFGAFFAYHQAPPVPFIPEEWHGRQVALIVGMWTGDLAEGEARWAPVLKAARTVGSLVAPMPYPFLNAAFDSANPPGLQGYWKADFARELSDDILRVAQQFGSTVPSLSTANHFYPIDGAVQRVPAGATAFPYRDVNFAPVIAGAWEDPADNEANIDWVRRYWSALHEFTEPAGYINFQDADDQARIETNYGPSFARLAQVKSVYDPDNFFHVNQNIKPAHASEGAEPAPTEPAPA